VPTYLACFFHPIQGWSDGPWYHAPFQPRPIHATNMLLEIRRWLRKAGPWYDKRLVRGAGGWGWEAGACLYACSCRAALIGSAACWPGRASWSLGLAGSGRCECALPATRAAGSLCSVVASRKLGDQRAAAARA
jgi:hypothetical protein